MKKLFFLFVIIFTLVLTANSQIVAPGYCETISNMNVPLNSGMYQVGYEQTGFPDNHVDFRTHLLVLRHSNMNNNHQLQIASNYRLNDRIFFRKIQSYSLSGGNAAWIELATRETNKFTGNQTIEGVSKYFTMGVSNDLSKSMRLSVTSSNNTLFEYAGNLVFRKRGQAITLVNFDPNGNVTLGSRSPVAKANLTVNGIITANEIRAKADVWADFVFSDNYELPSLKEVKKHITENKHLPGIPTEKEAIEEGVNVVDMQVKLLQKIEELTLYMIKQEENAEKQQKEIESLNRKIEELENSNK